jgi:succinate dehydrogenase/fumarate reductase flavoprotein subunit
VLPMPNGDTVKKALYRQLRRSRILISNRYMATRLLTADDGRVAGAIAVNTRTAEFLILKAKAVILCMGAAGRLGLPTSGYSEPTRTRPTPATATPWPITRVRRWRTSSASRSIR